MNTMLCTDDSHPDLIIQRGHIDRLIRLGLSKGYSIFEMYQVAVLNPVQHYNLPVGLLREGDRADFIVVDNLNDFNVIETYIEGQCVAKNGKALFDLPRAEAINTFNCLPISEEDLKIYAPVANPRVRVIEAEDGELLTGQFNWEPSCNAGNSIESNVDEDILKIVVVNRYNPVKPVVGFIKNFGLKHGALAGSVAHDSHNIVGVGCNDRALLKAINAVIEARGGIVATDGKDIKELKLPIAGLMSAESGEVVAEKYTQLNRFVADMGCAMKAPFMTMAFMSLLVIPSLKIGDRGLFDVDSFSFTSLFVDE
jgi:adenine deaminase